MIPVPWAEIEALGLGRLDGVPEGVATAIRADSRLVGRGELFVALNRGVDHVCEARERGAATLVPSDQLEALAALAGLVRSKSTARVVAVVGSTGKTSTKDILGGLCSAAVPTVFATESQNNEIGLPLTVLRLEPDTRVLVTEMGMRGHGQISALCAIARPELVVVTAVGPEHLELLGSVEEVARANAEAVAALPPGGVAVVPATAPELEPHLRRTDIRIVRCDPALVRREGVRWAFPLAGETVALELPFESRHMVGNTLAALLAYDALGLPREHLEEGARRITLSRWRGETLALPGGGFVVNDAYNANPVSMRAALADLAERSGGRRRVAIIGEMAELGDGSPGYHREIGALLGELELDVLVAVGEGARPYLETATVPQARWVPAPAGFDDLLRPGDAILVKASRAVGLEGVPARIAKLAEQWSAS